MSMVVLSADGAGIARLFSTSKCAEILCKLPRILVVLTGCVGPLLSRTTHKAHKYVNKLPLGLL